MKTYTVPLSITALVGVLSVLYSKDYIPSNLFPWTSTAVPDLGRLSPSASIVLPKQNATYFSQLTKRFAALAQPDISAVIRVGTESDVLQIINFANKEHRNILAGSSRHGWALSLNDVRNAIMIDIQSLSNISIDTSTNTMTVGGGVKFGDVVAALHPAKKQAVIGVCDCVGLLGAGLGGGHGGLQGLYGLIADNLVSARLATATGEIITVSKTSHTDLYWGLRGAGHNFGIVTEAVFNIYDQINEGMQFNAEIFYSPDQIETIFTAVNEFEQPPETTVFVIFLTLPSLEHVVVLSFVSSTSAANAISQINNAFGHIPHLSRTESVIPWDKINTLGMLGLGVEACVGKDRKNAYSASVIRYDIPTMRAVYDRYAEFISNHPLANGTAIVFESYAVHGVQAVDASETAYAHREENHIIILYAGYPDASLDGVTKSWMESSIDAINHSGGFGKPTVYLNYAQGPEGFGAIYGYEEWRQEKLKELKRKYDPEGMFSGYNPIPRT